MIGDNDMVLAVIRKIFKRTGSPVTLMEILDYADHMTRDRLKDALTTLTVMGKIKQGAAFQTYEPVTHGPWEDWKEQIKERE